MSTKAEDEKRYRSVAEGLREFGYPDVTVDEVRDVCEAMARGVPQGELPHGVVGLVISTLANAADT